MFENIRLEKGGQEKKRTCAAKHEKQERHPNENLAIGNGLQYAMIHLIEYVSRRVDSSKHIFDFRITPS